MSNAEPRAGGRVIIFAWTVALFVLALGNFDELLASLSRISTVDHRAFGYAEATRQAVRLAEGMEVLGRAAAIAAMVYAFALLRRRDSRWPGFVLRCGLAYFAFELAVNALFLRFPPPAPEWYFDRYRAWAIARAAVLAACLGFVARSAWVRRTFVGSDVDPPASRRQLVLAGFALVAWPFALNPVVDVSALLAALFSPTAASEGGPASLGLIWGSVAHGLFLALRHGARMRSTWMALAIPALLVPLFLAFTFQSFLLHFR